MTIAVVRTVRLLARNTSPSRIADTVSVGVLVTATVVGAHHRAPLNVTLSTSILSILTDAHTTFAVSVVTIHSLLARSAQGTVFWGRGTIRNLLTSGGGGQEVVTSDLQLSHLLGVED